MTLELYIRTIDRKRALVERSLPTPEMRSAVRIQSRQNLYVLLINCIEKTKKKPGMARFLRVGKMALVLLPFKDLARRRCRFWNADVPQELPTYLEWDA